MVSKKEDWGTDVKEDLKKRTLRARKEVPKGGEQGPKLNLLCRSVWGKVTENSLCNGS